MLNQLHVQNFALIQDLTLQLKSGLNIITGETGAGKSILLNALGLLSGKRADLSIIRKGTKKCIVEGDFSLKDYGVLKEGILAESAGFKPLSKLDVDFTLRPETTLGLLPAVGGFVNMGQLIGKYQTEDVASNFLNQQKMLSLAKRQEQNY